MKVPRSVQEIKQAHAAYQAKGGQNDLVRFAGDVGVTAAELLSAPEPVVEPVAEPVAEKPKRKRVAKK